MDDDTRASIVMLEPIEQVDFDEFIGGSRFDPDTVTGRARIHFRNEVRRLIDRSPRPFLVEDGWRNPYSGDPLSPVPTYRPEPPLGVRMFVRQLHTTAELQAAEADTQARIRSDARDQKKLDERLTVAGKHPLVVITPKPVGGVSPEALIRRLEHDTHRSIDQLQAAVKVKGRPSKSVEAIRDELRPILSDLIARARMVHPYDTAEHHRQYEQFQDAWNHTMRLDSVTNELVKEVWGNNMWTPGSTWWGIGIAQGKHGSHSDGGRRKQVPILKVLATVLDCSVRTLQNLLGGCGRGYVIGKKLRSTSWTSREGYRWRFEGGLWQPIRSERGYWTTADGWTNRFNSGVGTKMSGKRYDATLRFMPGHVAMCEEIQVILQARFRHGKTKPGKRIWRRDEKLRSTSSTSRRGNYAQHSNSNRRVSNRKPLRRRAIRTRRQAWRVGVSDRLGRRIRRTSTFRR